MDIQPRRPVHNRRDGAQQRYSRASNSQQRATIRPVQQQSAEKIEEKIDKTDEQLIDLYSDFNEDVQLKSDKELEELKRLAQMDALKAYSFIRRAVAHLKLKFSRLGSLLGAIKPKHVKITAICLSLALVTGYGVKAFVNTGEEASVLGLEDQEISFDPLLPVNNLESVSARSYDEELGVFSYQHTVGQQRITVAQQPMPASILEREDGLAQVAGSLGADGAYSEFGTNKGKAYTSMTQQGGQIAVFSANNLLVFINSLEPFDQELVTEYINALN